MTDKIFKLLHVSYMDVYNPFWLHGYKRRTKRKKSKNPKANPIQTSKDLYQTSVVAVHLKGIVAMCVQSLKRPVSNNPPWRIAPTLSSVEIEELVD